MEDMVSRSELLSYLLDSENEAIAYDRVESRWAIHEIVKFVQDMPPVACGGE